MGLIRNPDVIRLTPDDPIPNYLGAKVVPGPGVVITRRAVRKVGYQAIIGLDQPGQGSSGTVFEAEGEVQVPSTASLVLVNAASVPAVVTLPHPGEVIGWLSVVCLDNSQGITLKSPDEDAAVETLSSAFGLEDGVTNDNTNVLDIRTKIFDRSNIEFHAAGDSLIFASNRVDTWFCIGRYSANWYA